MKPKTSKAMEERFNRKLQRLLKKKKKDGRRIMTKQEYSLMIIRVTAAKEKTPHLRTENQSKCLRKYDVVKVGRTKKLITPVKHEGETRRFYVHDKQLFKILHRVHIRMKHGSVKRMHKALKSKYKNITRDIVQVYVRSCAPCARRAKARKSAREAEKEEEKEAELGKDLTRGQVECLRMYPCGTSPLYQYLMMYHDNVNMYDVASPLESSKSSKIAKVLCDIFKLFGTPDILQSANVKGLAKRVVKKLRKECPGINIQPEEVKFKELWKTVGPGVMVSRDPSYLDIGDIFTSWNFEIGNRLNVKLSDYVEGRRWGRTGERRNPYDAMFVRNLKTSPRWSHLSGFTLDRIRGENLVQNRKPVVRLYNKSYF